MDVCGVTLLFGGVSAPMYYYCLYCQMQTAYIYMGMTAMISISLFVLCLTDWFNQPENWGKRVFSFVALGAFIFVPFGHIITNEVVFDNFGDPFRFTSSAPYFLLGFACFAVGAALFMTRYPEIKHPKKFDICGCSHQLWHALVVVGSVFVFMGQLESYHTRTMSVCPA